MDQNSPLHENTHMSLDNTQLVLQELMKHLLSRIDGVIEKRKQKTLANIAQRYLDIIYDESLYKDYIQFLDELVKLHLKFKDLGPTFIIKNINLDKYPKLKPEIIKYVSLDFEYSAIDDLIQALDTHIKATKIKKEIPYMISKLTSIETESDNEAVYKYKKFIVDSFIKLKQDTTDDFELVFDPSNIDDLLERIQETIELAKNKLRIPSGYETLDSIYLPGGFESGRIYIFGSEPGFGKSTLMINFVKNFITRKYDPSTIKSDKPPAVLYVTLENDQVETFERLSRTMLQSPVKISQLRELELQKIRDIFKSLDTKLIIKYLKPGSDIADFMLYVDSVAEEHRIIAIVVDYLDLFNITSNRQERRHELGEITFQLKILGIIHDCPIISPTQLNTQGYQDRYSGKINIPSKKTVDESRQKAQNADFLGLLFEIPKEFLPPQLQYEVNSEDRIIGINIDKNRDNPTGIVCVKFETSTYTMKFYNPEDNNVIVNNILRNIYGGSHSKAPYI